MLAQLNIIVYLSLESVTKQFPRGVKPFSQERILFKMHILHPLQAFKFPQNEKKAFKSFKHESVYCTIFD